MEKTAQPVNPLEFRSPNETQYAAIQRVRDSLSEALTVIMNDVPGCAERTLAIRKLEEVAMWTDKAILFDGERYL